MVKIRNKDALLLGIAAYSKFNTFSKPDVDYLTGYTGSYGGGFMGGSGFDFGDPASGHGGNPGKNGKAYQSDYGAAYLQNIPSLTGEGAKAYRPGGGSMTGSFGYGGGKRVEVGYANTGGGGGWYGGGTGFGPYGAGGGSSICITPELMTTDVIPVGYQIPYNYLYPTEKPIYITGVNEGDGKCKITSLFNGEFNFEYTGQVQEFTTPADDVYFIEIWGGAGAGEFEEMTESGEYSDAGGYGGYVNAGYTLPAGVTLYIYIGQAGWGASDNANDRYRAWNGGGSSNLGYSAGGAGSDVRWARSQDPYDYNETFMSRFIVAGGGGGYGKPGGSSIRDYEETFGTGGSMEREYGEGVGEVITPEIDYPVNHNTIVEVKLDYMAGMGNNDKTGVPIEGSEMDVEVDVAGYGKVMTKVPVLSGVNSQRIEIPLDTLIPDGASTEYRILKAKVKSNVPVIVPPNAITLKVKTKKITGEDTGTPAKTYETKCYSVFEGVLCNDVYHIYLKDASNNPTMREDLLVEDMYEIKIISKPSNPVVESIITVNDIHVVKIVDTPKNPVSVDGVIVSDVYEVGIKNASDNPVNVDTMGVESTYEINQIQSSDNPTQVDNSVVESIHIIKTVQGSENKNPVDNNNVADIISIKFE